MSASKDDNGRPEKKGPATKRTKPPEWANGLRQLYDSVVEEPIPDSFKDLLDRFDEDDTDSTSKDA